MILIFANERANGEFNVVTLDENGYVFYEVKFRKKSISKTMIDEEIEQVKLDSFAA